MEYRFNDEQNKKVLSVLIILIIFIATFGGLIFYISNDKLAVMSRVDKVFDIAINNGFDIINNYEKENIVEDVEFKVNMEQKIDNETISNELLTGNLHTNLSKINEYKIVELVSNIQDQNTNIGIYEKEGLVYLKLQNETYQLNEEPIEINEKYNMKDIQDMYNLIYKTAKQQLKEFDFYRLKNDSTKETKVGIALTDKRVKEIILDTLSVLKSNEEFIDLYANIREIEKDEVEKEVEKLMENIDNLEMTQNNVTKLEIYTSGLLNQKTDKIVLTRTETGIIKFAINMYINESGASIDFEQNNKKINITFNKINEKYTMILSGTNFNFKFDIEKYNFSITANYGSYNMYMQFIGEENYNGEIVGNGNIGINIDANTNIHIIFDEKLSFEQKEEEVNLGNIKPGSELFGSLMMLNSMEIY